MQIQSPNYTGRGLVNLISELELRLTSSAQTPTLEAEFAARIPQASTYVLVLFDGLGSDQLGHQGAKGLSSAHEFDIDAPFPTTTTVSLATLATGVPSKAHGLIAYHLWLPEVGDVVNTIHMTTQGGNRIDQRHESFLPTPNLWERLAAAGIASLAIQPEHFDRTPLSRALYRGATFIPYSSPDDAVDRTVEAASSDARLVFLYVPDVDFAAHTSGQASSEYSAAIRIADTIWSRLVEEVPPGVGLVATSDHGHIDVDEQHKVRLTRDQERGLTLYGDARIVFVKGDGEPLAHDIPATWIPFADAAHLWGTGTQHPAFEARRPDGLLVADDGFAIFHSRSNDRLVGHHGGLTDKERTIPVLTRS